MLVTVPNVLTPEQVAQARQTLEQADWVDGRITAGPQAARAKHTDQLADDHPAAREVGNLVLSALQRNPLFIAAALPLKVFPPVFNRYKPGNLFGVHVDNAIRQSNLAGLRMRTDLSATLFLANPEDYDGGELTIEDTYGAHRVKLPPGHMILYPSTSLHHVRPITRGERLVCCFWVQSMIREDSARTLLFDLDSAIQRIARDLPDHESAVQLTSVYHNLLRRWAEV
jgi:PKHD-type hydroxylase